MHLDPTGHEGLLEAQHVAEAHASETKGPHC